MSKLTVLVPVFDPNQEITSYLEQALISIVKQSRIPDEILVTANHSLDFSGLFIKYPQIKSITRIMKNSTQNAPDNINFGILNAQSDYVKILFQDDLLETYDYIENLYYVLETSDPTWIATSSKNVSGETLSIKRVIHPKFSERLVLGENRIGSPSVITVKRKEFLKIDSAFTFMYDCDWYLRMAHNYGPPLILKSMAVLIRLHPQQDTHKVKGNLLKEIKIAKSSHSYSILFRQIMSFVRHRFTCRCLAEIKF